MDDYRFRPQQSSRTEAAGNSFISPPRNGARLPPQSQQQQQQQQPDLRSGLSRRFTTDSGRVPTLSSMSLTSPQRQANTGQEYNQTISKVQLIEKKKQEYERIVEQRRKFELEMLKLDQQSRREAMELAHLEDEMTRVTGHQSEPTTPPEHYSSGFPNAFSRPSRYSMSSLASPPGFQTRPFRSGSQVTSPPSYNVPSRYAYEEAVPSRSVPTTRRNSDEEERHEALLQDLGNHRSNQAANRYSMPVSRTRNGAYDGDFDGSNVTRFLFGEDIVNGMGHANAVDDRFPTLVRRDDQMLSASSAALDLALSSSPIPDTPITSNWSSHINRHRTQQSLSSINGAPGSLTGSLTGGNLGSIGSRPASLRHSVDLNYISENGGEQSSNAMSGQGNQSLNTTPPKLQSSFSANDVPTVKNGGASSGLNGMNGLNGNANNHAQQHFHNHNASMGRIPAGIPTSRHSRELSNESNSGVNRDQVVGAPYQSLQSALQASAAPFGPSMTTAVATPSTAPQSQPTAAVGTPMNGYTNYYPGNGFTPVSNPNTPGGYNMNMMTAGLQQLSMDGANGGNMYPSPTQNFNGYGGSPYNQAAPAPPAQQPRDSQARVMQNRRQLDNEAMSRYTNTPIETFQGQIYDLCKDQHGCRYLQKKLEERTPEQVHLIWAETNMHVIELMTDPFGNYLCQKLLEFCNDDERTVLIQNAAQDMVRIALNQHGTRALQKMIEYVSTPQQVHLIIEALRFRVVELIQDLNGNHVIQKCLNKLTSLDAQFIFDAVGNNCVEVGTHRHGCCVLQRCIDHASGDQKNWLIARITEHARILVQDPFGNYVVQYIIDLNEGSFTEPIVSMFQGCVSQLSRHKFSSNVIEKCLRCSTPASRDLIVQEMLAPQEIERLLRDSFANYVVQTALDYATIDMKFRLVESIRPILPLIRATPYGRRIQAKVSSYDNRGSAATSGQGTPADNTQGQIPLRTSHSRNVSGSSSMLQSSPIGNTGSQGSLGQASPGNQAPPPAILGPQGSHGTQPGYPPNTTAINGAAPTSQNGGAVQHPQQQQPQQQQQYGQFPQANYSHTNGGSHPSTTNSVEGGEPRWM